MSDQESSSQPLINDSDEETVGDLQIDTHRNHHDNTNSKKITDIGVTLNNTTKLETDGMSQTKRQNSHKRS